MKKSKLVYQESAIEKVDKILGEIREDLLSLAVDAATADPLARARTEDGRVRVLTAHVMTKKGYIAHMAHPEVKKTAMERGQEMMLVPMSQLPPLATDYAKELCREVGMCLEVLLTAWVVYAQIVEGLKCDDERYQPSPSAIAFYKKRGYKYDR
jgi:hypothetical protein